MLDMVSNWFSTFKDEGITICLEEIEYNFRGGTISVVPADNLASQYLGGYKSLASALGKCRQCMAIDDEIQTKVYCLS